MKNEIIMYHVPQIVKLRKYVVDIPNLKQTLISHKKHQKISNKQIAASLNVPTTLVEHWFRKDNCFAIPNEDKWFDLKKLLNIQTNEFDKSIMEFEYKDGVFEKSDRYYLDLGIAPTLTCESMNEKFVVTK